MKLHNPVSAGEILKEFMGEQSVSELANELGISRVGLSKILNGHTRITAQMAIKLGEKYQNSPMFWLNLSNQYELWQLSCGENK